MFWIGFGAGFVACFVVIIVASIIPNMRETYWQDRVRHERDARTARRDNG